MSEVFTALAVLESAQREGCPFSLINIPFGVFSSAGALPVVGTAVGDYVLDLCAAASRGLFEGTSLEADAQRVFGQPSLNEFIALGRPQWRCVRAAVQELVRGSRVLPHGPTPLFHRATDVRMHMPILVGDYTDFYSSKEHAINVGTMFRGPENALNPNWVHMPIAYHGRSSSVVVSGTPVVRPCGQIKPATTEAPPVFGPTAKLDFELEMAFVVGTGNRLGQPVSVDSADEHIFGVVLMNDWSARDIQAWEYVPLGPFLGKNFGTVISPWVVTLDALEPFRVSGPAQEPQPLPYLRGQEAPPAYDVALEVSLSRGNVSAVLCSSNLRHLYWSFRQQLAHHTVNGCNMRPGDLCGTGTISGPTPESRGSLLELTANGKEPITLPDGDQLSFVQDGDVIVISGTARNSSGACVGFGDCVCPVLPMHS